MSIDEPATLDLPALDLPVDFSVAFDPIKYSRPARLAIIGGISLMLWALIIVGGWGLYSLIA